MPVVHRHQILFPAVWGSLVASNLGVVDRKMAVQRGLHDCPWTYYEHASSLHWKSGSRSAGSGWNIAGIVNLPSSSYSTELGSRPFTKQREKG